MFWLFLALLCCIGQHEAYAQQPTINLQVPRIDLCFLVGTCGRNNQGGGGGAPAPDVTFVEGQWVESNTLNNNLLYLFANDNGAKNWYDAERFCESNGGYLAEPYTTEEADFLRNYAAQQPQANWWIGLRETEKCNCISIGRSATQIPGQFDHAKTLDTNNDGLVRLTCPPEFQKSCNPLTDLEWRWGLSGSRLTVSQWKSGEPNDSGKEHCVTLWSRGDNFKWADWGCEVTTDGPNLSFKPICQRDKLQDGGDRDTDYDDEDDYDYDDDKSEDLVVQPTGDKCLVENAKIAKPVGLRPLSKENNVASYTECKQKCVENSQCSNWSWKGQGRRGRRKEKCVLFGDIANLEFRQKPGSYSGTVLDGCSDRGSEDVVVVLNKSFCVEWGALYGMPNSDKIDTVKERGMDVAACRQNCLDTAGCVRYSWKKASRNNNANGRRRNRRGKKNKCILFREGNFQTRPRTKFVSGNILGKCREVAVQEASECHCADVKQTSQDLRSGSSFFDDEDQESVEDFGQQSLEFRSDTNQLKCPGRNVKRCSSPESDNAPLVKGQYCVDFHIYYADGGDEIEYIEDGVANAFDCRKRCEANSRCRFYSYSQGSCSLLANDDFTPEHDDTATSGSVQGGCRDMTQDYSGLGFCECQELDYDYEEGSDDYGGDVDLVGLGVIDVRTSGISPNGCSDGQGRRCYLATRGQEEPIKRSNIFPILRSSPLTDDGVIFPGKK